MTNCLLSGNWQLHWPSIRIRSSGLTGKLENDGYIYTLPGKGHLCGRKWTIQNQIPSAGITTAVWQDPYLSFSTFPCRSMSSQIVSFPSQEGGFQAWYRQKHITKTFHGFKALRWHEPARFPKGTIFRSRRSKRCRQIHPWSGTWPAFYRPDCGSILIDGTSGIWIIPEAKAKFYLYSGWSVLLSSGQIRWKWNDFIKASIRKFDTALFDRCRNFSRLSTPDATSADSPKVCRNRYAFWLTICANAELMILDEPMDDWILSCAARSGGIILSKPAKIRLTILISSHNLRELEDAVTMWHHAQRPIIVWAFSLRSSGNVSRFRSHFRKVCQPFHRILKYYTCQTPAVYIRWSLRGDPERAKAILEATHTNADRYPSSYIGRNLYLWNGRNKNYEIKDILY